MVRVIITGGGTGGHVYPALAIARGIAERHPGSEILYIGTSRGFEAGVVPQAGLPFFPIPVRGLRRKLSPENILAVWHAGRSYGIARAKLREFAPQVVVGTGGYVCGPVIMAAARLKIPTLIHEQNALPGLTNRILSRVATKTAITFMDAYKYFPEQAQVILSGLPVRPELLRADRDKARETFGLGQAFTVLSFGGSQGARTLNRAFPGVIGRLGSNRRFRFVHATGSSGYEEFKEELTKVGRDLSGDGHLTVAPYFHDMPRRLAAADLVVCRAGASTLAEITALGLPSVLIPYPYATGNHQEHNARALADRGAAIMILDRDLTGEGLADLIADLSEDRARLERMHLASLGLGKPRALEHLLDAIDNLAR